MSRDTFAGIRRLTAAAVVVGTMMLAGLALAEAAEKQPGDKLEQVFRNPPPDARIRTYGWHWINGFITKEGITADLESMAKAGFVGAIIYHGGNRRMDAGERDANEKELEFMRRSGATAASNSPYILEVGPVPGYLDEDHLAMLRHAADEARRLGLELGMHAGAGWSGSGGSWIKPKHAYKNLRFAEHKVKGGEGLPGYWRKKAYDPEKGVGFVGIVAYPTPPAETAGAKPQRVAGADGKLARTTELWKLWYSGKSQKPIAHGPDISNDATVDASGIIDLTPLIAADGSLKWSAPAGDWTVLIADYSPGRNGQIMAMPSGDGLDCDRLDPAALECHWENGIKPVLDRLGDHVGTTFKYIQLDSQETGNHTWGAILPDLFRRLHGYDLLPWLPALTGRVVGDAERTERFLRDYRKAMEVAWKEGFTKPMSEKCRAVGMRFVVQPYCSGSFGCFSFGAAADILQAEFWYGSCSPFRGWAHSGGDGSLRESASVQYIASIAHTTGKNLVTCESFTSYLSHYLADPSLAVLKFGANKAWCEGINAFWYHEMTHNPYPGLRPGMYFGIWGTNFNPNALSWRDQMPAWHEYMARNQALLQAGRYVADFLVHDPSELGGAMPNVFPAGYRFDIGNDDILLQLSVQNGKLVLPSGMEYACLMFMSHLDHFTFRRFTPEVLAHVAKLVEDGATVLGEKPLSSWTLKGGEAADQEFDRLVKQLWAGYEARPKGSHAHGKGKVWWGYKPEEWAAQVGLPPDLDRDNSLMIDFIHRRDDAADADWYLVHSGERIRTVEADVRFRVSGEIPELWDPVTGEMREAAVWREKDDVTELPLAFPVNGTVFVVFRKPSAGRDPLVAFTAVKPFSGAVDSRAIVTGDGKPGVLAFGSGRFTGETKSGKALAADVTVPAPLTLAGPWTLKFDPELGGPTEPVVFDKLASWHEHSDPKIKYYSGPASYKKTIDIPATMLGEGKRLMLDLGQVEVLAEVRLNGEPVAVAWCPPMAVDITAFAKPGLNELEIIAVNKWRNRWIGDEQLPPDVDTVLPNFGGYNRTPVKFPDWAKRGEKSPTGRILFSTFMPYTKNDPLEPAGLLGPVALRSGVIQEMK